MAPNRRRDSRVIPPKEPVGMRAKEPVRLLDLSRGGAQVESERPLPPGRSIVLQLPTTTGELALHATVLRCRARTAEAAGNGIVYRAGIRFDHLDPQDRELLEDAIVDIVLTDRDQGDDSGPLKIRVHSADLILISEKAVG